MPQDLQKTLEDPKFQALPGSAQVEVLQHLRESAPESWQPGYLNIQDSHMPAGTFQRKKGGPLESSEPKMVDGLPRWEPLEGESPYQTIQRAIEWARNNPDKHQRYVEEEQRRNLHDIIPLAAGTGASMALGPEAGMLAKAGMFGLGAAGGEAGYQVGQQVTGAPEAPQSEGEAAGRIFRTGAGYSLMDLGLGLAGKGLGRMGTAIARHADPFNQGIEDIFRASGPPTDPRFRSNVQTAAPDLAKLYEKVEPLLKDARGGIINPDMRLRVTQKAIDEYLRDMYQQERAAQISAGKQIGAQVQLGGNSTVIQETARRLSRTLPTGSQGQQVAAMLADNPLTTLQIADADELARAVNAELRKYEAMTPSEQAALRASSRIKGGLKDTDRALSEGINSRLQAIGQPGLQNYEKRYAALSSVREALEGKMNKAEAARWNSRLHEFFSLKGVNVRTSLGAFETPGSMLEEGLGSLKRANLGEPETATARPIPQMGPERQLGRPATPMGGPPDTSGPIPQSERMQIPTWEEMRTNPPGKRPPGVQPEYQVETTTPAGERRAARTTASRGTRSEGYSETRPTRNQPALLPPPKLTEPAAQVGQPPPLGFPSKQMAPSAPGFAPQPKPNLWEPGLTTGPITESGKPTIPTPKVGTPISPKASQFHSEIAKHEAVLKDPKATKAAKEQAQVALDKLKKSASKQMQPPPKVDDVQF